MSIGELVIKRITYKGTDLKWSGNQLSLTDGRQFGAQLATGIAMITGFRISYGDTDAGVTTVSAAIGNVNTSESEMTYTVTLELSDNGGTPTKLDPADSWIEIALLAELNQGASDLAVQVRDLRMTGDEHERQIDADFARDIDDYAIGLHGFDLSYTPPFDPKWVDHHVKAIEVAARNVNKSGKKLSFTGRAIMEDDSGNTSQRSAVTFTVFAKH